MSVRDRLFGELDSLTLIDPHTHIDPLNPAAKNLADLLGYHYYTELAHSAGLRRDWIEERGISPKEKVGRLVEGLEKIDNTIQYSWLLEIAREFFDFTADRVTLDNWESLYDAALAKMALPDWERRVLAHSKLEAVFLTNDFDDPLAGFDPSIYIPCLRTDELVFHLGKPAIRERLQRASGIAVDGPQSLRRALGQRFEFFLGRGCKACAISLPPDFAPCRVENAAAERAIATAWRGEPLDADRQRELSLFVFWTLAELCDQFRLPFDLMIGVNRAVYPGGVFQGQDLYDSRVSLIQYRDLFNAFPNVTFLISVLASVTNQELTSFAWIFPNVVAHGHWWYSNTPAFIERDLAARLEAAPRNKQIGYYSDMYKLEFALPKFAMYKRILAKVLAENFCCDRGWGEERAVELGKEVLRGNVERVFGVGRGRV